MVPRLVTVVENNLVYDECSSRSDDSATFHTKPKATSATTFKQQRRQQQRRSPVSVSSFFSHTTITNTNAVVDGAATTATTKSITTNLDTVKSFLNKLEKEQKIEEAAALYLSDNDDFHYTSPQFKCNSKSEWMDMMVMKKNKNNNSGNSKTNKLEPTFDDQVTVDVNTGMITRRGIITNFTSFNVTVTLLETYEFHPHTGRIQRITVTRKNEN